MQISFNVDCFHPLVRNKLSTVKNRSKFIRNLIRDDISCHDILTADLSYTNTTPAYGTETPAPTGYGFTIKEGEDDDILDRLRSVDNVTEYIIDLIYYSIGEDPERHKKRCGVEKRAFKRFKSVSVS